MPDPIALVVPWWRIVLDVTAVVGTFAAVSVALFGQAFRSKFFPPRLTLSLAHELGEKTEVRFDPPNAAAHVEDGRYYHLRVENRRRWSPATDARVVLLQLEEPGPDGRWQVRWTGDIPMQWRHGDVLPPARVIGPVAFADLCSVVVTEGFRLHTLISPYVLHTVRPTATKLALTVQAHSAESNSDPLRIEIAWDGGFHTGAQEMRQHLTVEVSN